MESFYLETFLEVVNTGNVTNAAESLCISQSTVSRRIKFMESQHDYQLLNRIGTFLTPTAYGKIVQEKAEQFLTLERELSSGLKQVKSRKKLTFACTPTFGAAHLPKIQSDFIHSETDITELNFTLDNPEGILEGLREGRFEMAVLEHFEDYDLGMLQTISLPDDDVVFVTDQALDIATLEDPFERLFQLILYGRKDGCISRRLLEKNLLAVGRQIGEFDRIQAFDDFRTIIDSLADGDGVAFLSKDLIKQYSKRGELNSFHLPGFTHSRKRTLVFSDTLHDCKAGEPFIDLVLAHLQVKIK
jgi:DNA-binding transcriptional LysR family regulator